MAIILSIIRPIYIIDINWVVKLNRLYYVWCRKNRPSQFIVVQHGLYLGGIITDNAHKYAKCDIVLCWGEHSVKEFLRYNSRKRVKLVLWGNPLYNLYDRDKMCFKETSGSRVLVVPTVIKGERKKILEDFMFKLQGFGFDVYLKEHNYQSKLAEPVKNFSVVTGNLHEILLKQEFDIIVSDTSTSLVDAIYFKNKTLYFSPKGDMPEYTQNAFAHYMKNISCIYQSFTNKEQVLACIDINRQENLLNYMVFQGKNDLSILSE